MNLWGSYENIFLSSLAYVLPLPCDVETIAPALTALVKGPHEIASHYAFLWLLIMPQNTLKCRLCLFSSWRTPYFLIFCSGVAMLINNIRAIFDEEAYIFSCLVGVSGIFYFIEYRKARPAWALSRSQLVRKWLMPEAGYVSVKIALTLY